MSPNSGDNAPTQSLTPSACIVGLTTASGHSSVRGGYDDGEQATNSDDSDDGDLSANRFGLDLDGDHDDVRTEAEAKAEHYSELVARQWGTPEGEWWP